MGASPWAASVMVKTSDVVQLRPEIFFCTLKAFSTFVDSTL